MRLNKKIFIDNQTVIMAEDMNNIQDAIIKNQEDIEKLGFKTATATWYGVTIKFYKAGRLVMAVFDGNITAEVASNNTTNITFPEGFKALATKYEYEVVAPLRMARVYFSLNYMRVTDIVNFSNVASALANGTGVRFTVSYIAAE